MRRSLLLLVGCALATALGCGDGRATVSGHVTFNGEPISRGSITLVPVDGRGQPSGASVEQGRYRIASVPPGDTFVQIVAVYPVGREKRDDGSEFELVGSLLPDSWGAASKERLTVVAPSTTQNFEITGPDPRKTK